MIIGRPVCSEKRQEKALSGKLACMQMPPTSFVASGNRNIFIKEIEETSICTQVSSKLDV